MSFIIVDSALRYQGQLEAVKACVFRSAEHEDLQRRYGYQVLHKSRSKRPYRTLRAHRCRVRLKAVKVPSPVVYGYIPKLSKTEVAMHFYEHTRGLPVGLSEIKSMLRPFGLHFVQEGEWRAGGEL